MKKSQRLATIQQLLKQKALSTHQEIIELLALEGISANQAAISRDLKKLKVLKIDGLYVLPARVSEKSGALIQSMHAAGDSMIVVKTSSGAANAAAVFIDQQRIPSIVGTIAGDDTIFVATSSKAAQTKTLKILGALIR